MTSELVSIDIPDEDRELNVVLLELDAPWQSAAPIESILVALERLDLGLARMSVDFEDWSDYDRRAAAAAVWKGVKKETSITLSTADERCRASVSRYDRAPKTGTPVHRNTVTFTLPASEVRSRGLGSVETAIANMAASLDAFAVATATACAPVRFPALADRLPPPRPLSQRAWLHIVADRAWPMMGLPPRLPDPPLRAERRNEGNVWIWSYPDPLRYDTREAIAGMQAFSDQLQGPG